MVNKVASRYGRCEDPNCEDPEEEVSLRWRDYIRELDRGAWLCDGCWEVYQDADDFVNENFMDMD